MKRLIVALITLVIGMMFYTLLFFGAGKVIIWAFNIDYVWTGLHALACTFILMVFNAFKG